MTAPLKLKRQSVKSKPGIDKEDLAKLKVASVLVDTPVSHLEGLYDYLIPSSLTSIATIGTKVIVEFGKKNTEGLIVGISDIDSSNREKKLIQSVSSPSGFISQQLIYHLEQVRNRFGGSFWNLLKQAVPARIIKEEKLFFKSVVDSPDLDLNNDFSRIFEHSEFSELRMDKRLRWAVNTPAGVDVYKFISELVKLRSKIGQVLLVVPDEKDILNFKEILAPVFGDQLVELGSHLAKNERYRNFLIVSSAEPAIILATRSGIFAPLSSTATLIVFSDLDNSHYELHSPGWNTRDVSLLRAQDVSLMFVSASHSLEIERLIDIGWLERKKFSSPSKRRFITNEDSSAYLSQIRIGASKGNVLVSVAEKGYGNLFLCSKCRNAANCECGGKLQIVGTGKVPRCYICYKAHNDWRCNFCGGNLPYVISKGIERLAEEIGRALPKIPLLVSSGTKQIRLMPKGNHIVLATAGSEPQDLYAAVILFDGERIVNRPFLRSEELARHTWFSILNRSLDLAEVFISLPNKHPLTQSLLRSDSSYLVKQILKERKTAKLPPFFRMAVVTGIKKDISKFSENLKSATTYEVNGPIDIDSSNSKLIIRASLEESSKFVDMLDDVVRLQGLKGKSVFQIRLDPFDL